MKNYYKVLGIPPNACASQIKQAYKELAARYKPDENNADRYAGSRFMDISIAYNTLINPDKRKDYDRILSCIISTPAYRAADTGQPYAANTEKDATPGRTISKTNATHIAISLFILLISILAWANMTLTTSNKTNKKEVAVVTKKANETLANSTRQKAPPSASQVDKSSFEKDERASQIITKERTLANRETSAEAVTVTTKITTHAVQDIYLKSGQTYNDVLQIQGTPSSIVKPEDSMECWYYGSSMINFKNGRVASVENRGLNLMLPPQTVRLRQQ